MDRIAILIPCYNESKTIGKAVSDFRKEIPCLKDEHIRHEKTQLSVKGDKQV